MKNSNKYFILTIISVVAIVGIVGIAGIKNMTGAASISSCSALENVWTNILDCGVNPVNQKACDRIANNYEKNGCGILGGPLSIYDDYSDGLLDSRFQFMEQDPQITQVETSGEMVISGTKSINGWNNDGVIYKNLISFDNSFEYTVDAKMVNVELTDESYANQFIQEVRDSTAAHQFRIQYQARPTGKIYQVVALEDGVWKSIALINAFGNENQYKTWKIMYDKDSRQLTAYVESTTGNLNKLGSYTVPLSWSEFRPLYYQAVYESIGSTVDVKVDNLNFKQE